MHSDYRSIEDVKGDIVLIAKAECPLCLSAFEEGLICVGADVYLIQTYTDGGLG